MTLKELIGVADTRKNKTAKLDLLAAIAGRAEKSPIKVHKEISELSAKGFIKCSFLMAMRDYMGITNDEMMQYFEETRN